MSFIKSKQLKLWDGGLGGNSLKSSKKSHGGVTNLGKRKTARPFVRKKPIHLVVRSSKARGELSFLRPENAKMIQQVLDAQSYRHYVKILSWVNVGNHLHIKLKAYTHTGFKAFMRSFTALIARKITGAKKGKTFGRFWDALAFTRVLMSSFEELGLSHYFKKNNVEASYGKEIRQIFFGKDIGKMLLAKRVLAIR